MRWAALAAAAALLGASTVSAQAPEGAASRTFGPRDLFGPDVQGPLDFTWMVERLGRCHALIWSTATAVLAAGTSVVLDLGLMRRADRERIRKVAQEAGLSVQWHFVDAPPEVRRARIANRNETKGETFAAEVPPEMFDMFEALYEAPAPADLEDAVLNVTD